MNTKAAMLVAVVLAAGSTQSIAQNKLDKPLDKNTLQGSGGVNIARPNLADELRFRNAIVTGNAPGGFSFRGDVGYRAPGEFFGSLGSNENFSFRRDSYYSGLAGLGIRGTDALQYQFAMTTGNAPPPGFTGQTTFSRSGAGTTAAAVGSGEVTKPDGGGLTRAKVDPTEPGADIRGLSLLSLRSPSAFVASRGLEPTVLSRMAGEGGQFAGISASPLLGVSMSSNVNEPKKDDKPRPGSVPTINDALPNKVTDAKTTDKADNKVDDRVNTTAEKLRTSYDDLLDRLKTGADSKPTTEPAKEKKLPDWEEQLAQLRAQLNEKAAKPGATKPADGKPTETRPGENRPTSTPGEPVTPGSERPKEPQPGEDPTKRPGALRQETLDLIRGAGIEIKQLVPEGFDAYSSNMKSGQQYMAATQYFYAEERFTAALALKPGDPLAAIGRVHAQLGAGMFLSSAINLKALFVEHPEMAAVKYGAELMPTRERIKVLIERLSEVVESKDAKRRDSGLLMAYLAYQSGDEKARIRGLEVAGTMPAGPDGKPPETPDQLQKLATMLSSVWSKPKPGEAAAPAEPTPNK